MRRTAIVLLPVLFVVGLGVGWLLGSAGDERDGAAAGTPSPTPSITEAPWTAATPTSVAPPTTTAPIEAPELVLTAPPPDREEAMAMARTLGPLTLPSTCTAALGDAYFLPNAPREYRSGVHQGADFMCRRTGETAVAALPGRVVMAHSGWTEPTFGDRQTLLDQAAVLGRTPDSTLTLLYGRHVVLDHGLIPDVGHVVTVSAHLDSIDPAVVLGTTVEAGQPIGVIGASGTSEASDGSNDTSDHHLHWELYVDDQYLGAGLNGAETVELYQLLLGL